MMLPPIGGQEGPVVLSARFTNQVYCPAKLALLTLLYKPTIRVVLEGRT